MVGARTLAPSTNAINSSYRPDFKVKRTPTTSVPSGFLTMDTATPLIKTDHIGRHRIGRPVNRCNLGRQGRAQQLAQHDRADHGGQAAGQGHGLRASLGLQALGSHADLIRAGDRQLQDVHSLIGGDLGIPEARIVGKDQAYFCFFSFEADGNAGGASGTG